MAGTIDVEGRLNDLYELQKKHAKLSRKLRKLEGTISKDRNLQLESVKNYGELLDVALWEIEEYGLDTFASFPVFTGTDHPRENLEKGAGFIRKVSEKHKVWSQIPYLDMNLETKDEIVYDPKEKFEIFFKPLIASGLLKNMVMKNGWEAARGCRTELEYAKENNLNILYEVRDVYGNLRIQKDLKPYSHLDGLKNN